TWRKRKKKQFSRRSLACRDLHPTQLNPKPGSLSIPLPISAPRSPHFSAYSFFPVVFQTPRLSPASPAHVGTAAQPSRRHLDSPPARPAPASPQPVAGPASWSASAVSLSPAGRPCPPVPPRCALAR
uniref:Uncharacterized protein n=1 Tax=Aegilops tauschii subsp. strangulata TaxID=200361 RepID=A0A453D8R1_AEGTS